MSQNLSDTQSLLEKAIDRHPLLMAPNTPITEAIAAMSESNTSYILIVEKAELLGIFTERDAIELIANKANLAELALSQVMTTKLMTIKLVETHNIYSVLANLESCQINYLPMINDRGQVIGAITPDSLQLIVQEICDRAAAAEEFLRLNAELEQLVQERTKQLIANNQELQQVINNLQITKQELINSEKMAALGKLIAGVAHEINTPLAAIRSSVQNISEFLKDKLEELPTFFRQLSPENQQYFFALLQKSTQETDTLSSKEKRQLKKALQRQLESEKIAEADSLASTLADIGVYHEIEPFLPLLKSLDSPQILQTAYRLSTLQKSTRTIATATERAAKIVFALKTYGRYDNSAKKVLANIIDGIETVLTLYQYQIKQGVELVRNYAPNLPSILCYPDELHQVWTNLLHNSLQAMDYRGTLTIEVKQQGQNLLVKIADTGKGISREILPRIFEPFFTTKMPGEGSGLGLDIVNKIIDKHYGKIEVESQVGQTTFTIFLPLNQNQE